MIREPSAYCRIAQKTSFHRKLNSILSKDDVKWKGQHFWNKRSIIATPLFMIFAIVHWRTK